MTKWRFWNWLFYGAGQKRGLCQFWNLWLVAHIAAGLFLAFSVQVEVSEAAKTILLPLAGIFIGLSFAWIGGSQALLQRRAIEQMTEQHEGQMEVYL